MKDGNIQKRLISLIFSGHITILCQYIAKQNKACSLLLIDSKFVEYVCAMTITFLWFRLNTFGRIGGM